MMGDMVDKILDWARRHYTLMRHHMTIRLVGQLIVLAWVFAVSLMILLSDDAHRLSYFLAAMGVFLACALGVMVLRRH